MNRHSQLFIYRQDRLSVIRDIIHHMHIGTIFKNGTNHPNPTFIFANSAASTELS